VSKRLMLRTLTEQETHVLRTLVQEQKVEARWRDRARICWLSHEGQGVQAIVARTGISEHAVRRWITRVNAQGPAGWHDAPRTGRPRVYTTEEIGTVVATRRTKPDELGLPFGSWTLDRLVAYLQEVKGIAIKRSRVSDLLPAEGLRWRTQETWFGERLDPAFAEKRGDRRPLHRTAAGQRSRLSG
jgi:transposase